MIIGSAGDTGTQQPRRSLCLGIIRDAREETPPATVPARLVLFGSAEGAPAAGHRRGEEIAGLDGRPPLTEAELAATDRIVAMAGVHPYMALLEQGADVIIGGRSSDCAVFAAPAIHHGFPEALAYYLGKVLECASFCAEPYGAKETVLGEITARRRAGHRDASRPALHDRLGRGACDVRALEPVLRICRRRPAGYVPNATTSRSPRRRRVTGPRFHPAEQFRVKLEGSGKVGERYVGLVGMRDPYSVANVDQMIDWAQPAGAGALRRNAATNCTTRSMAGTA